jgi:tetratricopeptide (TPR) repeat protein
LIHFERDESDQWILEAEKAESYLTGMIKDNPKAEPIVWSLLSICHALQNDRDEMLRTLEKAREFSRDPFWDFLQKQNCEFHIAIAYLVLGETEKALETLEEASQLKSSTYLNRELQLWFIFDRLRGNPRFDALLEE